MLVRYPSSVHRAIVVLDVERFGDFARTNMIQVTVREALYQAVEQAFGEAGIPRAAYTQEDRGDGILILVGPEIPKSRLVDQLPERLVAALREHNLRSSAAAQIRMRMAFDAGEVLYDGHGVTGESVIRAFRLLDAPVLKDALSVSTGLLALITSDWFYRDLVRHVPAAAPDSYVPSRVVVKETDLVAWIRLPDNQWTPPLAGTWWRRRLRQSL